VDDEADEAAETTLIQAFADFVRSMSGVERPTASMSEALLTITDAARYLSVSTSTVRNLAVGGKLRSTRVGDRIRFRRDWLDSWIDTGGGDVPAPTRPPAEASRRQPTVRPMRRRAEPKPKPRTYIQRIGDQELRLLADPARDRHGRIYTWHVGVQTPLCGAGGRWASRLDRYPSAYMCPKCLTGLAAFAGADLARFGVTHAYMLRLTYRGETATMIRAGYHSGNGRRTLCGTKEVAWALTERAPSAKQCFVCDHRTRWDARDLDPNILVPRPITPLRVLVDAAPIDPRLLELIERHPLSLDARQAAHPLAEDVIWSTHKWHEVQRGSQRIGHFMAPTDRSHAPSERWNTYTVSDSPIVGFATTEMALQRLPQWADNIERALVLYGRWAKESSRLKPASGTSSRR
jgi:excisionase family DNA binding protein